MNPNPEVKTLYSENLKKLKEKIEADTRWKDFPGIYIERKKENCEDNHATKSSL